MSAKLSFILSQFMRVTDRLTDRRTDTFAMGKIALHTMQRGKNEFANTFNTCCCIIKSDEIVNPSKRTSSCTVTVSAPSWRMDHSWSARKGCVVIQTRVALTSLYSASVG